MKIKKIIIPLLFAVILSYSCDKNFGDININPLRETFIEPVYQLNSTQIIGLNMLQYESTIIQQAQILIGGAEEAGNRNSNINSQAGNHFNTLYGNQIKNLVDIIRVTKDDPNQSNIYNMARIMKAYCFMLLVDRYADVPYSEAGLAYIADIRFPKYDKQEEIYDDIIKELTEAVNALDAGKDRVNEMYFGGDIARWKKFGNSVLLRVGMRYTKIDGNKAKTIVQRATDPARGGVMTSNNDNVVLKCNTTQTNPSTGFINGSVRQNWHVGEPFVNFMKNNKDPRLQYIAALYPNPTAANGGGTPNTNPEDQVGCPYGYNENNVSTAPGFPGIISQGVFKYSQFNRSTVGRTDSWLYYVTYSQTSLLLAEARFREYITTGTVKDYYEAGIKAHLTQLDMWATTNGGASPITAALQDAYLLQPEIAFNPNTALKQINEQYWVSCLFIWIEAYANWRRSGYPELKPLNYPGEDEYVSIANGGSGFIQRLPYPQNEYIINEKHVREAAARIGGDNMGTRVFWDKKM